MVRSLKDRLRNSFNISIAEIDVTDLWQRATLGVVSISGSRDYLEGLMRNVEQAATRQANNLGAEVVDSFMDYLEPVNSIVGCCPLRSRVTVYSISGFCASHGAFGAGQPRY